MNTTLMTLVNMFGYEVRNFMDNTAAGQVISVLMFIAILTVYFTMDGDKKETR